MPWLVIAGLVTVPIEAKAAQFDGSDVRTGTFVGARFRIPLGGRSVARPCASLAVAPTLSRLSSNGEIHTSIGEGAALNLGAKPTLTLMGIRADEALGIGPSGQPDAKTKLGVSSGGWVAIGVGTVALVGGIAFLYVREVAEENSD